MFFYPFTVLLRPSSSVLLVIVLFLSFLLRPSSSVVPVVVFSFVVILRSSSSVVPVVVFSFAVLLRPSSSALLVVVLFLFRSSSSVLVRATGRGVVPFLFFFVPPPILPGGGGRQHICGSFEGRGGRKVLSVAAVFFEAIDLTLNRGC